MFSCIIRRVFGMKTDLAGDKFLLLGVDKNDFWERST